jgi:hypothetical protein
MRIDRPARVTTALFTFTVGVALTIAGCGSGEQQSVQISPDAQKKTQDMLSGMQKKMQELHKGEGKAAKRGG